MKEDFKIIEPDLDSIPDSVIVEHDRIGINEVVAILADRVAILEGRVLILENMLLP